MARIDVVLEDERVIVRFIEYRDERQLKDLYKLYKKASGHLVSEYRTVDGETLAITDNAGSVTIGRNDKYGCFLRGQKKDAWEIAKNAFDMLCYRYSSFRKFETVFGDKELVAAEAEAALGKLDAEGGLDGEDRADVEKLLGVTKL